MKINWGTGIVIAFVLFISFIGYFVVRMNIDTRTDHELVTDNYYEKELIYQQEIDAQKATIEAGVNPKVARVDEGLLITFSEQFEPNQVFGEVSLYRPSNQLLDFNLPIKLSNTHMLIPDKKLVGGRWDLSITWTYKDKKFLYNEKLTY